MLKNWKDHVERQWSEWEEWKTKRQQYFEKLAKLRDNDPCRTRSSEPPKPGWVWEEDVIFEKPRQNAPKPVSGWVPATLSRDAEPKVGQIWSALDTKNNTNERPLRLDEKYTLLAAVHDWALIGVEQIDPWQWPANEIAKTEQDVAVVKQAIPYFALRSILQEEAFESLIKAKHELLIFLADVEADLKANVLKQDQGEGPAKLLGSNGITPKQIPWCEDAPEYIPLTEAVKLVDGRIKLSTLSRIMKPNGEMRYMRKGQRCKVHIGDFRQYMKGRVSDLEWAKAYMNYIRAVGKGDLRFFWRCKKCGYEYPDNADAPDRCPKCKGECDLVGRKPPKPRR